MIDWVIRLIPLFMSSDSPTPPHRPQALEMGASLQAIPEKIHPIATADYPLPAHRPQNSRLDCSRLEHGFQLQMPTWLNGVTHALRLILK
jgi:dTDP-4-dehydrorhamnose reductase